MKGREPLFSATIHRIKRESTSHARRWAWEEKKEKQNTKHINRGRGGVTCPKKTTNIKYLHAQNTRLSTTSQFQSSPTQSIPPISKLPQKPSAQPHKNKHDQNQKSKTKERNNQAPGLVIPHFFKHSSGPQFDPVPTGVILLRTSSLASSCPKAAFTSSGGKPLSKTWPTLVVPASEESRAETSWALEQPVFRWS
jgi:hypothetical protein